MVLKQYFCDWCKSINYSSKQLVVCSRLSRLRGYHEFLWIIKEQLPIEQDEGYPGLFWNHIHWLLNFDLQCVTAISMQKNDVQEHSQSSLLFYQVKWLSSINMWRQRLHTFYDLEKLCLAIAITLQDYLLQNVCNNYKREPSHATKILKGALLWMNCFSLI